MIVFAISGPSSSVQTGAPSFEADSKAESVGAKTVKVFGPAKVTSVYYNNWWAIFQNLYCLLLVKYAWDKKIRSPSKGLKAECYAHLPDRVSWKPEMCSNFRKVVNLLSRSACNVCTKSPTGSGNITLSTAWATPWGISISRLFGATFAPFIVINCLRGAQKWCKY